MPSRQRMSVMDVPFWDYGQGKLRQTACPVFRVEGSPEHDVVRERYARVLEWCPTLRRRVVTSPGGLLRPSWVDDPEFDLDYHVRPVTVAAPGDDAALWRTVSDLYRLPFDLSRPAWEAYHITGLAGGGAAIMHRTFHFQVDGLSAIELGRVLSDECADLDDARDRLQRAARRAESKAARGEDAAAEASGGLAGRIAAPVRKVVESIGHRTETIWPRADLSWQRTLVAASLDMATMREIRRRTRSTVTAVFQTVASLGVGAILGDLPAELTISLPMSTRHLFPQQYPLDLNSRQVSAPFVWPMGEADPARRLDIVNGRLGALKLERDSFVRTVELARYAPHKLIYLATRRKILASNLIVSAAPGPKRRLHLDGHTMGGMHLFTAIVPANPIAIVGNSYADRFDVGITADPTLVDAVLDLPKALEAGLEELDAATR